MRKYFLDMNQKHLSEDSMTFKIDILHRAAKKRAEVKLSLNATINHSVKWKRSIHNGRSHEPILETSEIIFGEISHL